MQKRNDSVRIRSVLGGSDRQDTVLRVNRCKELGTETIRERKRGKGTPPEKKDGGAVTNDWRTGHMILLILQHKAQRDMQTNAHAGHSLLFALTSFVQEARLALISMRCSCPVLCQLEAIRAAGTRYRPLRD